MPGDTPPGPSRALARPALRVTAGLAVALGFALLGCTAEPTTALRWRLADAEGEAPALTSVTQCSSVGVASVRVSTLVGGTDLCSAVLVDEREYACLPEAFALGDPVDGPALEPGDYAILVQGLRRSGDPWPCGTDDEELDCALDPELVETPGYCVARALVEVSVDDSSRITSVNGEPLAADEPLEVVLEAPPECDDGIDNDGDGKVDGTDVACLLAPEGPESADASVTFFQPTVSFLGTEGVKPVNVEVNFLDVELDGEPLAYISRNQLDYSSWEYELPLLFASLEEGEHEFSITGVRRFGLGDETPVTQPLTRVFSTTAGFPPDNFDFASEDFLAPLVYPFALNLTLTLGPDSFSAYACELGGLAGPLLERMWIRVTDEADIPLDAATLGLNVAAVDEAGGWVSFDCPATILRSAALDWGRYSIQVEGRIGGETCFESGAAQPLLPQPTSAQALMLDRVLDGAAPPPACQECINDDDCDAQLCSDGICVD